ncbi:MAG: DUF3822 family protein [Chitinophagaceae bacterium]|nr:DUF3822 family protein [Chitinophagaceae bacterium]
MSVNVAYQIQVPLTEMEDAAQCNLYVEVAADHLLFGILNNERREFIALQYVNLDKYNAVNHCKELVYHNEWLARSYNRVIVVYYFPESILVPEEMYDESLNKSSLDLIYGDLNKGEVLTDHVADWNLYNVYRVPAPIHELLGAHFPKGHFFHAYTVMLKRKRQVQSHKMPEGDEALLIFFPNKLLFGLFRNGDLQIMQTFEYETAEDVVYHVLNVCLQFQSNCEQIVLRISGLMDDHSAVYAALQKYFLHVELDPRPAELNYKEDFNEYPAHFFTSLFNIALCE